MKGRIELLDDALVDQIAAREVVERPSSVVKELVENAIDAQAASITVDLEDGGRARIRVTDDGVGMIRADAELAVRRHATSKIRAFEDLVRIRTLGFRGEALPSIASVSRFSLTTRPRELVEGTRVVIHGGELLETAAAGTAPGTIVDVRELFYNVPARLKFLKSRSTEAGAVFDVCLRAALAHPGLRLLVTHDGRRVREYLPVSDLPSRAETALAEEGLRTVRGQRDGLEVVASLGAPEHARTGARGLHLFVNGRPVTDVKLARAVAFAYGSVLPPGKYPAGVVHLFLPVEEVDVNAHPQKAEVRFAKGREVLDTLTRILGAALGTQAFSRPVTSVPQGAGPAGRGTGYWEERLGLAGPTRDVETREPRTETRPSAFAAALAGAEPHVHYSAEAAVPLGLREAEPRAEPRTSAPLLPSRGPFGALRFLGQARKTFLVCEGDEGLVVLDQHAVDERILYDRLRRSHAERAVRLQRLLFPERVEVRPEEAELVEAAHEELARAGLECTLLGTTTVAVHTVPSLLGRASPARLLRDLLDELARAGDRGFGDAIDTALATMACHGAIRAGDTLAAEECVALLRALDEIDAFAGHCPHGRPVVVSLPFAELERKLGR